MNAELKVRCSHTEKLLWEQAAVASGSTLSWWVRATLKAEAESVVEWEPSAEETAARVEAPTVAAAAVPAAKPPSPSRYVQDLAPNPETRAAADRAFASLPSGRPAYKPPTYK